MNRLGTLGSESLRTVDERRIVENLLVGGWAYELREGACAEAREATSAALARWVHAGLPVSRGAAGERFYDPVEVVNFMKLSGLRDRDPFWTERFLSTGRRFVLAQDESWLARGVPGLVEGLGPRRFRVTMTRTFDLSSLAPGRSVRLRLPLPVEDGALDEMTLELVADGIPVSFSRIPGRLEARLDVPEIQKVSLGWRAEFTARPSAADGAPLDEESLALYTRPSEGFVRVTPRVSGLARELAGEGASRNDKVRAFWNFILDHALIGPIHYHEIDMARAPDWLLDNVWMDCQMGSAVLVSLCRAAGIPARVVGGNMLYPFAPTNHYWAEIWFEGEGWAPYDLLAWDLSNGGRDAAWRDCFAGRLDYRMKTLIMPRIFLGPMSLALPAQWHVLVEPAANGLVIGLGDAASGRAVYRDEINVETPGLPPGA